MSRPIRIAALLGLAILTAVPAAAKNTITVTLTQILGTTDPAKVKEYTEYLGAVNTYEGLTTVNGNGNSLPTMANKGTISPDNKVYTFSIDPKAIFQDGEPVKAKDVVWSIRRMLAINAEKSAGTGPYALTSFVRGGPFTVTRFPGYHKGFAPGAIDEVRFIPTTDEATVKALATRGELSMSSRYQATETYDSISKLEDYKIIANPTATGSDIKLNHLVPPTDDVHVRRVIAYALDYTTIRETLYLGTGGGGPMAAAFADACISALVLPKQNLATAAGTWASMSWLQDKDVEAMIDTARSEINVGKQNEIYKALQKKLVADQTDVFVLTATERL
ncbi:MAG: hypothetical protein H7251_19615, partial [Acetobacteraceae bacterium]|nr:hypothetical protein [Acetobacteraceae bacterium]